MRILWPSFNVVSKGADYGMPGTGLEILETRGCLYDRVHEMRGIRGVLQR